MNPTSGMATPITDMSSLILMESSYPLIPRVEPIDRVVMNPNQEIFVNVNKVNIQ